MPPSKSPSRRPKLPMMHAKGCYTPAPPNQTSYWRRRKAAALAEEIRDLQDDITLHSTSETSGAPSCAKDGRTQAHDEQPGTQELDKHKRGDPTTSCTRRQQMPIVLDLTKGICDLKRKFALRSTSATSEAPSCAKDGRTQAHSPGRKNATSLKGATSRRHVLVNARKRREISTTQKQSRSQGGSQD